MIGWLKYLPLHFRHDHECTDSRGPSFSRAKPIHLLVNGCKISMRAPRHSSKLPASPVYWKKEGLDQPFRAYNSALFANENWTEAQLLSRRWSYWTAWFAGSRSELYMNAQLLRREEGKEFGGASFFHPRSFEYALTNYLNVSFGHRQTNGRPDFKGPAHWRVHKQLPIFSASFIVECPTSPELSYVFPISDDVMFQLSFRLRTVDKPVREAMEALARDIIGSVSMETSPETKAQIERVKADCPEMSLTENFAPLKWPIAKEDIEGEAPSGDAEVQQRKIEG